MRACMVALLLSHSTFLKTCWRCSLTRQSVFTAQPGVKGPSEGACVRVCTILLHHVSESVGVVAQAERTVRQPGLLPAVSSTHPLKICLIMATAGVKAVLEARMAAKPATGLVERRSWMSGRTSLPPYYEALITQQLEMHLGGQAPPRDTLWSALCRAAVAEDGAAVVLSEGEKAFAVWLALPTGALVALCSCGGRRGAESADVRHMLGLSSSCVHAHALMLSTVKLVAAAEVGSALLLLAWYPVLNNSQPELSHERVVHYATNTSKKRGIFAVLTEGMWTVSVIRPRLARARSSTRTLMRTACTQLSCAKRHWWCSNVKAVTVCCAAALEARAVPAVLGGLPPDVKLVDVAGAP